MNRLAKLNFFGWAGALAIVAIVAVNELVFLPLAPHSQFVALIYAAISTPFLLVAGIVHVAGTLIKFAKSRDVLLVTSVAPTIAIIYLRFAGVIGFLKSLDVDIKMAALRISRLRMRFFARLMQKRLIRN